MTDYKGRCVEAIGESFQVRCELFHGHPGRCLAPHSFPPHAPRGPESEPAPPTDGPPYMHVLGEDMRSALSESRAEVERLRADLRDLQVSFDRTIDREDALRDRVRVLEAENAGLRHSRDRLSVMFDEMVEERDRALAGPPEREEPTP